MCKTRTALTVIVILSLTASCHYDIVRNKNVKLDGHKCICIESIKTQDPYIGTVLRDVIEKEFVKRRFEICDANRATILINGSAFLTERAESSQNFLLLVGGGSASSSQAIESVSLMVKNTSGEILATASYDNSKRYTASKLATEFGGALAERLKK